MSMKRLEDAVAAIYERWHSPNWIHNKDQRHTGKFIKELVDAMEEVKSKEKDDKSPDTNVEAVRERMRQRAEFGLTKYGVTTERGDLTMLEWIQHAQDEAMDLCVYLERIKKEFENFSRDRCKKCYVEMKSGIALENTVVGLPDFSSDKAPCTVSAGGPGKLVDCMKCPSCGYSIY